MSETYQVAVFEGDGIGPEITAPCLKVLDAAMARVGGIDANYTHLAAGAKAYLDQGVALPDSSVSEARKADAILLSAMGDPDIRYPDGTELVPQIELRIQLGLYAGVRPVRAIPGVRLPLSDERAKGMDFVLVRESTEGLFASIGKGVVEENEARETMVITRKGTEDVVRFSLGLADQRKKSGEGPGILTCVDKANVFSAFAFFREIFDAEAKHFPDVETRHAYVDAMAIEMLKPWNLDVLVTENMFGDILSDLGAGLMGGLGFAPSADIGDEDAVFQPCHGSAPDIKGKGLANPTAMFLSGGMMLEWIGEGQGSRAAKRAGLLVRDAVDHAFSDGKLVTYDQGGTVGTQAVFDRVMECLQTVSVRAD